MTPEERKKYTDVITANAKKDVSSRPTDLFETVSEDSAED